MSLILLGVALPPPAAAQLNEDESVMRYHVRLPEHRVHRVHVRASFESSSAPHVDLFMPVWTPGSYLVREFARHVLQLTASDDAGSELPVRKVDKNSWRIETRGAATVHVDYVLYANERSVRTNHVDADHAFLSPAATFLTRRDRLDAPCRVSFDLPDGWTAYSGAPDVDGTFLLPDYDALVDSPFEIGPHRVAHFDVDGIPHRVVVAGAVDLDSEDLAIDLRDIAREVVDVFGHIPFERYTFLMIFGDSGGGGLEHKDSSVCMASRWDVTKPDRYRRFLSLAAHEYFHAWNVKRFRPAALGPFDYERENYTPDLWVAEGITSYYDDLITLRAGFAESVQEYLSARGEAFRAEAERPGGRRTSLAQASLDAWIKHYRPDENFANHTVSYYSKGALVALLLDMRIRRLTMGASDLSDVLRLGWTRYTAAGLGFPPDAMTTLASDVARTDLSAFFADHVHGTAPLLPDEDLAWVGLRLHVQPKVNKDRDLPLDRAGMPIERTLGIQTEDQGGLCRVQVVLEGGPSHLAGLNHDDLILAVNDMRVSASTLQDRLDRTHGPVTVTYYRGQSLRTAQVVPDERPVVQWTLAPLETVTQAQRDAFRAWTKWDHPAPTTPEAGDADDEPRDASATQPPAADDGAPVPADDETPEVSDHAAAGPSERARSER